MMQAAVVDASLVAQWLVPESTTPQALRVLREVAILASPDLVYAEVGNVLWKRVQRGELAAQDGAQLIEVLRRLPLSSYASADLLPAAFQHATATGATVYDGLYVALAEQLRVPLITADTRLLTRLQASGVAVQTIYVGDVEQWL